VLTGEAYRIRAVRQCALPTGGKSLGKGISDAWLADQLRPFSIRSKTMWIDQTAAKGYLEADFTDAFRRYISRSQVAALRDRLASRQAQESDEHRK